MALNAHRRLGFTLVELLVVITIIGMLVALLLPAVHSVRERARQTQCMNNIKNIALAVVSYDSSRGQPPALSQYVKQQSTVSGSTAYADVIFDTTLNPSRFAIKTTQLASTAVPTGAGLSWAAMLLPKLERNDLWDSIVSPPTGVASTPIPQLSVLICPSDVDVLSQVNLPGLSYSVNSGGWDRKSTGDFLYKANQGDTSDNGVFFDYAAYDRQVPAIPVASRPLTRISNIKDGAGTTIMLGENIHKSYFDSNNKAIFSWVAGSEGLSAFGSYPSEQQLGFVWVVPSSGTAPVPADADPTKGQERISGNVDKTGDFPPNSPRFAHLASSHGSGANVAFCDGHTSYLRDDIDYIVYVQLMTPNGRKCVDPASHSPASTAIQAFQNAAPLSEKDIL